MWGNSQTIQVTSTGGPHAEAFGGQLVRVVYKRPETWKFFFGFQMPYIATNAAGKVIIDFDLTLGVGRSQMLIRSFESFEVEWAAFSSPTAGSQCYSNSVVAPARRMDSVPPVPENFIREISAQDIQLEARGTFSTTVPGDVGHITVFAFFSPAVHVRPEWFQRLFRGEEDKGE
jgi:hypothetical protein